MEAAAEPSQSVSSKVCWCERATARLPGITRQSHSSESYLKSCMISLRASMFLMILDRKHSAALVTVFQTFVNFFCLFSNQIKTPMTRMYILLNSRGCTSPEKFCRKQQAGEEWKCCKLNGGDGCSYSCFISWAFSWQSSSSGWSCASCLASCSLAVCREGKWDKIYVWDLLTVRFIEQAIHLWRDGEDTGLRMNRSLVTLLTERNFSR